jgi:hypothetical protein
MDDEFSSLSSREYASSCQSLNDRQFADFNRMVPYDFTVQRKCKQFFQEPFIDLSKASLNKDFTD